ncbi:MAG: glycosyltransferase [Candidatus Cloacimonetes bacterium]|nr:glycosyltransferase [Candidatus Cloacimonadota bacterium]
MKKILILTKSHRSKDVRVYYKIALSLSKNYKLKILSPSGEDDFNNPEIEIIPKNRFMLLNLFLNAYRYKPDHIICVEPLTLLPGILMKLLRKTNLFYDCHEFFALDFAGRMKNCRSIAFYLYNKFENMLVSFTDGVITVNKIMEEEYKRFHQNVVVCANYPVLKELAPSSAKIFDFIYTGSISTDRGMLKILVAAKNLVITYPNLKILFIGVFRSNSEKQIFFDFINQNQLQDNVIYKDFVANKEISSYYLSAKFGLCFLRPIAKHRKAIALKLLEYWQHGLPTIMNNFDFIKGITDKINNKLLIDYTIHDLIKSMQYLLNLDEETKKQIIGANHIVVNTRLNWQIEEKKLIHFFRNFDSEKNLLLFAYFYPPLGGPGVQRPCKLVKYMKNNNWNTDVISVKNIVFHSYDSEMLSECTHRSLSRTFSCDLMSILKALTRKRESVQQKLYFGTPEKYKRIFRNIFPIDDKIGWFPFALTRALFLSLQRNYQYVMATMGPYTGGLCAYIFSKLTKTKLIIDYRDHWSMNPCLDYTFKFQYKLAEFLEKKFLDHAEFITVISYGMKKELVESFGQHLEEKIHVMYNGWDEEDFADISVPKEHNNKITFSYIGNFYGSRSTNYFIEAVKQLLKENELPDDIVFSFTGNYYYQTIEAMNDESLKGLIEICPQTVHNEAVKKMMESDCLLLFIPSTDRGSTLTGKIFEYIRTHKPILAMIPPIGEAADILRSCGQKKYL